MRFASVALKIVMLNDGGLADVILLVILVYVRCTVLSTRRISVYFNLCTLSKISVVASVC